DSLPEWRNWQTRQVEGLVAFTGSAGSSPVSGTLQRKDLRRRAVSPFGIVQRRLTVLEVSRSWAQLATEPETRRSGVSYPTRSYRVPGWSYWATHGSGRPQCQAA